MFQEQVACINNISGKKLSLDGINMRKIEEDKTK